MKIKKLKFKNFLSYGNRFQELNFENEWGVYLLNGVSGSGKSSIRYALQYGLYGKLDKLNLDDIPNRINKNLEVEIELDINGKLVNINRNLQPKKFEMFINNSKYDKNNVVNNNIKLNISIIKKDVK